MLNIYAEINQRGKEERKKEIKSIIMQCSNERTSTIIWITVQK